MTERNYTRRAYCEKCGRQRLDLTIALSQLTNPKAIREALLNISKDRNIREAYYVNNSVNQRIGEVINKLDTETLQDFSGNPKLPNYLRTRTRVTLRQRNDYESVKSYLCEIESRTTQPVRISLWTKMLDWWARNFGSDSVITP